MLRLWSEPPLPDAEPDAVNRCCSLEAQVDAQAVADRLGIPFYVINAEEPFRRGVVDLFIREYAAGRTPNPCLACNRKIRFGYLLEYARSLGARYLATGHYARIRTGAAGKMELWRGIDQRKDQSYVLSVLGQDALRQVLFPIGEYKKAQVRAIAATLGLPTASRQESQDLCFVADGDYRSFIRRWAPDTLTPGPVLDRQGRQLGLHQGLPLYTVGQRGGLGIAAPRPLYVLELQVENNVLIVGAAEELERCWLRTDAVNWIAAEPPAPSAAVQVQIRYHARPVPATVVTHTGGWVETHLCERLRGVTPGQAAVFYRGDNCLGGGTIVDSGGCADPGDSQ
jgi:tRNA-specific 2-thiouridylase